MDTTMTDFSEIGKMIVKEEMVLEKFDGEADAPDKVLRERLTVVDGEIVKHEFYDQSGELIEVKEV